MMALSAEFKAHLESGLTSLARCWQVRRKDGAVFGFTDHDCDLEFENTLFQAGSGMTALSLEQGTGLGVDNTEALGALSDAGLSERDIAAGHFDGAKVTCWLVNWQDCTQRNILFAGNIGNISRSGGGFQAEVRGLSEALNQPQGRVYQKPCTAVLGDERCRVDTDTAVFSGNFEVQTSQDHSVFWLKPSDPLASGFEQGWFTHGLLRFENLGLAPVLAVIKSDFVEEGMRKVTLWTPLHGDVETGSEVSLFAGCDKTFATCRFKFSNYLNFQGFPDLPNDEWIASVPRDDASNDGGSLR